MDIYEDDGARGILDIRKARRELRESATINIEGVRRAIVAEISAAALLDIAYSLRPIGAEAADALNAQAMRTLNESDTADELDDPAPARDFTTGDLVVVRGDDAPGEILGLGYDQDSKYALVRFFESGDELRVWVDLLEHVDATEPGEEIRERIVDAVASELDTRTDAEIIASGDHTPEEIYGVTGKPEEPAADDDEDDLDRDFDTDTSGLAAISEPTPEPAVSPLDALAEKAPAKKKAGKK